MLLRSKDSVSKQQGIEDVGTVCMYVSYVCTGSQAGRIYIYQGYVYLYLQHCIIVSESSTQHCIPHHHKMKVQADTASDLSMEQSILSRRQWNYTRSRK